MGSIYNSKYRSGPSIAMHRKLKMANGYKDDTPGPGSYLHFSEFGMWVPKNKAKGYNVRERIKTAKNYVVNDYNLRTRNNTTLNSVDNIRSYFRKKMERAVTDQNIISRRGRIFSAR